MYEEDRPKTVDLYKDYTDRQTDNITSIIYVEIYYPSLTSAAILQVVESRLFLSLYRIDRYDASDSLLDLYRLARL